MMTSQNVISSTSEGFLRISDPNQEGGRWEKAQKIGFILGHFRVKSRKIGVGLFQKTSEKSPKS
jgi:hypothetical protein